MTIDLPWKVGEDTGHFHALKKLSAGIRLVSSAGTSVVSQQIMALKDNVADIAAPRFWQYSFVGIAASYLGNALDARSCPYMFYETIAKILDDLKFWHDQSVNRPPFLSRFQIPDPESLDQPLTRDCIHDVDKVTNLILKNISIFRYSFYPSDLWRYIARREGDYTGYIIEGCDLEILRHMILDSIKEQLSGTQMITMDLKITIWRLLGSGGWSGGYYYTPGSLAEYFAWVNQLYPYLPDISFSLPTTLQVEKHGLEQIQYTLTTLKPPVSLEHMSKVLQGVHDHPVLGAFPLNWTPLIHLSL